MLYPLSYEGGRISLRVSAGGWLARQGDGPLVADLFLGRSSDANVITATKQR